MKIKRILLANSSIIALGEKYVKTVNYSCYPPLGLLTIATRLKKLNPQIEVEIVDMEIVGLERICNTIAVFNPDLVGISVITPTYETGLELAQYAKKMGVAYVVLGNDHASFFPELIVENRRFVDFVISGDNGEIDFCNLIDSLNRSINPFDNTNNLSGRWNGKIVTSTTAKILLHERKNDIEDIPDYKLLDEEHKRAYIRNYNRDFGHFHKKIISPITINNASGCNNFKKHCLYCSIFNLQPQWGDPRFFWQLIKKYHYENSINLFFEVCDNFGGMHEYRKELINLMPEWFEKSDIELIVYSRAFDIFKNRTIIEEFKKLHVSRVIIGLEAGNDYAIHQMRKGHPIGLEKEINKFAIEKLAETNIQLHSSFIFGTIGETEETLESTKEFIYWLKTFKNIASIEVSPLYPLPTSPAWDLLLGITPSKYFGNDVERLLRAFGLKNISKCWEKTREILMYNDIIDVKVASQLWLDYFTFAGCEKILKEVDEVNKIIKFESYINIGAFL